MESIQYILNFIFKLVIVLLIAWVVLFFVSIFFPALSVKNLLSFGNTSNSTSSTTTESGGWLPAPGSWQGLFGKAKVPGETDNVFVPGAAFNGYGNAYGNNQGGAQVDFVTYTSTGTQIIYGNRALAYNNQQPSTSTTVSVQQPKPADTPYLQKSSYIRNLSIYENGHVYTGLSFVGDARDTMFKDGKFPIIIADPKTGRAVSMSYAIATTNWSVPGWVRFQAKITEASLPNKIPCIMVFESAQHTSSSQPTRVVIPVMCN